MLCCPTYSAKPDRFCLCLRRSEPSYCIRKKNRQPLSSVPGYGVVLDHSFAQPKLIDVVPATMLSRLPRHLFASRSRISGVESLAKVQGPRYHYRRIAIAPALGVIWVPRYKRFLSLTSVKSARKISLSRLTRRMFGSFVSAENECSTGTGAFVTGENVRFAKHVGVVS